MADNFIAVDPDMLDGKACVRGMRLSVEFLLELAASGATPEQILAQYLPSSRRTASRGISICGERAAWRSGVRLGDHRERSSAGCALVRGTLSTAR